MSKSLKNEQENLEFHLEKLVLLIEKVHALSQTENLKEEEGVEFDDRGPDAAQLSEIKEVDEKFNKQEDDILVFYAKRRVLSESLGKLPPQDSSKYASLVVCHSLF